LIRNPNLVKCPAGLLLDLDGTVLPSDNRPTSRVVAAVTAAAKLIPVAIASGREQDEVGHFARLFGLTSPQVAENGATLMDPLTGIALNRHVIDRDVAEHLLEEMMPIASEILIRDSGRFIRDPHSITDWQISIIMAKFSDESEAREWSTRFPCDAVSAYATKDNNGDWYLDCTAPGIDKASGALDFAHIVGVEAEDLMVIGDGSNDIPMFDIAGISIAMADSALGLLDVATDVTADLSSDGAALAIEKYVLDY